MQFGLGAKYHKRIGSGSAYIGSSFYANKVEIPDKIILEAGYMVKLGENVWLDMGSDYSFSIEADEFNILTMGVGLAFFLP